MLDDGGKLLSEQARSIGVASQLESRDPTQSAAPASPRPLYTKIHGRYYDLAGFAHPGGCPALECARDRDATALFESYHALFRARPLQALKRYEVAPDEAESAARFLDEKRFGASSVDWEHTLASPFRQDLVACAQRYFREEQRRRGLGSLAAATRAPVRRWLEVALLGALFFTTLVFYVRGSWLALFAAPVLGWLFVANVWHDALHFAMSRDWRVNAALPYLFPWFISPKLWMHQHVIGHHVFPNDPLRDPDVRAVPSLLRQTPGSPWHPQHQKQGRIPRLVVLYSLVLLARNSVRDHLTRWSGWFNDAVPLVLGPPWRRGLHVAGRLVVAASLFVWPFHAFPFWKALAFAIVPSLLLAQLFTLFSQVNHLTEKTLAAGRAPSSNWYEAQARASSSYAPDSYLAFLLSGGLNLQIEHHLLPGVNHHHLFRLSPRIRALCEEHAVPYPSYPSLRAALRAHLACMRRLAAPPAEGDALTHNDTR